MFGPDPFDAHTAAVLAVGIDPPPQWSELLARFQAYAFGDPECSMDARLATAVCVGDDDTATPRAGPRRGRRHAAGAR